MNLGASGSLQYLDDNYVDWAACIPPYLQKLHLGKSVPSCGLLRHMILAMPHLKDVRVNHLMDNYWETDVAAFDPEGDLVGKCQWTNLHCRCFPDFREINLFASLDNVAFWATDDLCTDRWHLSHVPPQGHQQQVAAVASAVAKIVSANGFVTDRFPFTKDRYFQLHWARPPSTEEALAILRALAPFARMLPAIDLTSWFITKEVADSLVTFFIQTKAIRLSLRYIRGEDALQRLDIVSRLMAHDVVSTFDFTSWDGELVRLIAAMVTFIPRTLNLNFEYDVEDMDAPWSIRDRFELTTEMEKSNQRRHACLSTSHHWYLLNSTDHLR